MKYLVIIASYILGSLPWALIIGKGFYKTDIRLQGSGNLGGTNAGRVLGKKAGVIVSALDILKSVLAVFLGAHYGVAIGAICGVICTLGHCYPLFAGFRGGKAVSTSFGLLFALCAFTKINWLLFIIPLVMFFLVLYLFKMVSLGSIMAFLGALTTSLFLEVQTAVRLSILFLTLLIIYRHRQNIVRILNKTESKITWM